MGNTNIDLVRTKRREKNYTQEYVANYLGISREAYINFEHGKSNFKTKERLLKLYELLDISEQKETNKKKVYEIHPKSQIYEGLVKSGLAIPGNKVFLIIQEDL